MPPLERTDLLQTAVLWRRDTFDTYGEPTYLPPEEVACRWVDKRNENINPLTQTKPVDVQVILAIQARVDDVLWLGLLEDLTGTAEDIPTTGAMKIEKENNTPDIKQRNTRYDYGCMRYNPIASD